MNDAIERLTIFLLLLLSSGAGMAFFMTADSTVSSDGQPVLQVAYGLFYLALLIFLVRRYRAALSILYHEKWTALLFVWVLASTVWSVDPEETLRRSVAFLGTSLAGVYIGSKYEPKRLFNVVTLCIGIIAIVSLVTGLIFPSVGVLADGSWQGVFHLKNSLGRVMTLGVLLFSLQGTDHKRHRVVSLLMAVLCAVLVFLSQSATAVVVCILLLAALSLRRLLTWHIKSILMAGIPASMLLSAAFAWFIQNKDAILTALGRSSTLTGRLPLWHAVKLEILDQPFFGHGFSAFWTSSTAARLNERISWDAPNAHNSFLEVLLGLGVCGLFLLLMSLLQTLRLSWKAARSDQDATLLPLFFLLFLTLYSLTESTMLQPNSMLWMVYIGTSCWLVREQRRSFAASHELVEQEHSTSGQFALSGTASS